MLEKGGPRYALPLCANGKDRERGHSHPKKTERKICIFVGLLFENGASAEGRFLLKPGPRPLF